MATRFQKNDILMIGLSIIGLVVFLRFYGKVYPTVSARLKVSKNQALHVASQFLEKQGFNLEGYNQSVIFVEDDPAYLQRTLGMDQFNKIAPELPLMYWEVKFLREHDFVVRVDPQGGIISFAHNVPGDTEGARLKQDQALALASTFINKRMNIDLSKYSLTVARTMEKEKRIDNDFKWKASTPYLGDAKLFISAVVCGDRVEEYGQYIEYPENLTDPYTQERSRGELTANVSMELSKLLLWAAIVIAVIINKDKTIPWKGALLLASAMAVTGLMQDINAIPNMNPFDSTQLPLYLLWGKWTLETLESNLWSGVKAFALAISGWIVCQEVFAVKRLNLITEFRDLLSKDFARASFMGYLLAFIGLGYATVFYLVGRKYLNVWSPVKNGYSDMLNTYLPFLNPLTHAFQASVFEELLFRFFAIALLIKYLRSRTLALFIPALIWGFGHSNHEVFPFYTRGVEVTVDGLIDGYFFIRYGLITVVVAHFAYDAVIDMMPLLQSSNLYYFWSGMAVVGVIGVPMMLGTIGTIKEWRFARPKEVSPVRIGMALNNKGPLDEKGGDP